EIAAGHYVAHLLDHRALPELHQRLGFQHRNGVLQLEPAQIRGPRFDGQRRDVVALDANPDRDFAVGAQVGLTDGSPAGYELSPIVGTDQELTLDLKTHSFTEPATDCSGL